MPGPKFPHKTMFNKTLNYFEGCPEKIEINTVLERNGPAFKTDYGKSLSENID